MRKSCAQAVARLWVVGGKPSSYTPTAHSRHVEPVGKLRAYTFFRTHFVPGFMHGFGQFLPKLRRSYARFPQPLLLNDY
jgi:hypothetical protein